MKYPDTETLAAKFQLTTYIIHRQTEGISNEDSVLQPPVRGNCMNWILGHILVDRNYVLKLLGAEPIFSDVELKKYSRESEPVMSLQDGLPFDQLLSKLDLSLKRIEDGLKTVTPERLEEMDEAGDRKETVGTLIAMIHWHETYHTGQFELLRQLTGKNDKVI